MERCTLGRVVARDSRRCARVVLETARACSVGAKAARVFGRKFGRLSSEVTSLVVHGFGDSNIGLWRQLAERFAILVQHG
ncbi:hypothetical protein V6Z11_D12G299400 [Gossypium hirsutum]